MKYLLFMALFSFSAYAKQMELIKEHSKIAFNVDYMVMTTVEGQFKSYQAFFDMNEAENEISNVRVTIVGDSVDTSDTKRDFHLRGHEFFFVANYPEITFKSTSPAKISEGQKFTLHGEITLRGITKPLSLEGFYKGKKKDPWGKDNYFFTFTGQLNRKQFDIVWNKEMDAGGFLVGDEVRLNLVVQSQLLGGKTAFSTHMVPTTKGIVERDQLKKGKIKKLSTPTDANDHSAPKK